MIQTVQLKKAKQKKQHFGNQFGQKVTKHEDRISRKKIKRIENKTFIPSFLREMELDVWK